MKQFKIIIILTIISACIFSVSIKSVFSKNIEPETGKASELDDIENAIIIKGIEADSDDYLDEKDFDNFDGVIIYNNSFNNISQKNQDFQKENIIDSLKKQDSKWHLTSYKINPGENLWSIAQKYETDYKLILKANKIYNPDFIKPGKLLLIPNKQGVSHKVVKRDTVIGLSKKYGVKKDLIVSQNNIRKNIIKSGDILFIPDAVEYRDKTVKNSSAKKNYNENYHNKNLVNSEIENAKNYDSADNTKKNVAVRISKRQRPVFIWPLKGEITSSFGRRIDPINNKTKFHCGIDIGAGIGTPVKAAADGEAIFSGWKKGYGRVVILKHTDGYITVYAHNKENIISAGDKIKNGELIALSGMSGAVTGPHLHFEIRKYVTPLNPYRFLE